MTMKIMMKMTMTMVVKMTMMMTIIMTMMMMISLLWRLLSDAALTTHLKRNLANQQFCIKTTN